MMNNRHCYLGFISSQRSIQSDDHAVCGRGVSECTTDHLGIISRNVVTLIEPRLGVIRWSILQACC